MYKIIGSTCGKMKKYDHIVACKEGAGMSKKTYQVCATCIYFQAERIDHKMRYFCSRLKYETKSSYSFNCWSPKEHVIKLMEKRGEMI
jgi:hypothetical protein